MALPALTYDLVLILDPQAEETVRAKIVADTRAAIEAQGELLRHDDWGERALAYPIERKANGEYHLMQFHPSSAELLSGLDRTLRITDGIMRFRIIKLKPGVPEAPEMPAARPAAAEPPAVTAEPPAEAELTAEAAAESPAPEALPEEPAADMAVAESA